MFQFDVLVVVVFVGDVVVVGWDFFVVLYGFYVGYQQCVDYYVGYWVEVGVEVVNQVFVVCEQVWNVVDGCGIDIEQVFWYVYGFMQGVGLWYVYVMVVVW